MTAEITMAIILALVGIATIVGLAVVSEDIKELYEDEDGDDE